MGDAYLYLILRLRRREHEIKTSKRSENSETQNVFLLGRGAGPTKQKAICRPSVHHMARRSTALSLLLCRSSEATDMLAS